VILTGIVRPAMDLCVHHAANGLTTRLGVTAKIKPSANTTHRGDSIRFNDWIPCLYVEESPTREEAVPRALFIVYDFPPATSSGVFRPLRFLKRLPDLGWDVTVIAPRPGRGMLRDPQLLEQIPSQIRVIRTAAPEPRLLQLALNKLHLNGISRTIDRWCRLPDPQRAWVPFAVRAALKAHHAEPHDILWTSSAPYSAHLAGHAIHEKTGIPWIADFRDEWTTHPELMPHLPTDFHRRSHRCWENSVLTTANAVSSVSEAFVEDLKRGAPNKDPQSFFVLPNGFDEDDFVGPPPPQKTDRFTVLYPGRVYGEAALQTFLEGARQAIESGRIDPDLLRIDFIGHGNEQLNTYGLPDQCLQTSGQVSHKEAIDRMRSASLLLLLADAHRGPGVFPGKIFPFLACGRPILAIATVDAGVSHLLHEAGHEASIAPGNTEGAATALTLAFERWRTGQPTPAYNATVVARFGSQQQTAQLTRRFEQLSGRGPI
jgi:glycosyltransferase involved in cell wall biosynthesis